MPAAQRAWAADILHIWFTRLKPQQRFARIDAVDDLLRRRFARVLRMLGNRPAGSFLGDVKTAQAAILLFDQVPRNIFRSDPRAFRYDRLARTIAKGAMRRGWDRHLPVAGRQFLAMPLMHSEAIADQIRSLHYFAALGKRGGYPFAVAHHRMIARFGRFPHRNAVLGRNSTSAEIEAVAAGNHW